MASTLSFAKYGLFIYTKRSAIDANTLRKNWIVWFSYSFCVVWSVKQELDREKWVTCRKWKRSGDPNDFFFGHFVYLTANIAILWLYTIKPVLETHHLVLKAQRNSLQWWYASFKISTLISCRPWLFSVVYRVDTSSFSELCDSVDTVLGYRVDS